ncbi:hypothetical protein ACBJ59_61170 [Nonomuraea sp. MTCD27]|uniref:hypothetical protein n=1 Tax=Nonomuraea sp. MTCD27 TaxID=1676747 RepID=UPI0035C106E5
MSGYLLGELAEWFQTPAAAGLTANERLALNAVAERANKDTRRMWRHRGDTKSLYQRIADYVGVTVKALGAILTRLARRGLEVRIAIGTDKRGRPTFAHNSHAMDFQLPELPACVTLPEPDSPLHEGTFEASATPAKPVDNSPAEVPVPALMVPSPRDHHERSPLRGGSYTAEAPATAAPHPSKDLPSKNNPSTPVVPISRPEEEVPDAGRREPSAESDHPPPRVLPFAALRQIDPAEQYAAAAAALFTLPDLGQVWINAARRELGEHTPRTLLVIRAHALMAARRSA